MVAGQGGGWHLCRVELKPWVRNNEALNYSNGSGEGRTDWGEVYEAGSVIMDVCRYVEGGGGRGRRARENFRMTEELMWTPGNGVPPPSPARTETSKPDLTSVYSLPNTPEALQCKRHSRNL